MPLISDLVPGQYQQNLICLFVSYATEGIDTRGQSDFAGAAQVPKPEMKGIQVI